MCQSRGYRAANSSALGALPVTSIDDAAVLHESRRDERNARSADALDLVDKANRLFRQLLEAPGLHVRTVDVIREGERNVGRRVEQCCTTQQVPLELTDAPLCLGLGSQLLRGETGQPGAHFDLVPGQLLSKRS